MMASSLPEKRLARSDDMATSVEAARVAAKASPAAVCAVETAMADGVGRIDEEIWLRCREQGYLRTAATVRHGRLALSEARELIDTGETRATSEGAQSAVWRLSIVVAKKAMVLAEKVSLIANACDDQKPEERPMKTHGAVERTLTLPNFDEEALTLSHAAERKAQAALADPLRGKGQLLTEEEMDSRRKSSGYEAFLASKLVRAVPVGIADPSPLGEHLFPFQRDLVRWALRRGRAALFADTGLGKTNMQLEWARQVAEHTMRPVLILSPLAVGAQTVREAERFGILDVAIARAQSEAKSAIVVTNYDRLHLFDASSFGGVVLDESSILKSFDGSTRTALIEAFEATPFRLCCSATPAPNDHTELGNHAEFIGVMSRSEMLSQWFVHDGGSTQDWRLKGHAITDFWRWVCSWAALVRKPSDLGYANDGYDLLPLEVHSHVTPASLEEAHAAGLLFVEGAKTLAEQRKARRASLSARVSIAVETVMAEPNEPWTLWCDLNDEGDALEAAIPRSVQVAGKDSNAEKEAKLTAFAEGRARVMISKSSICGWGLNWQHCARTGFVGVSHSFEAWYQCVRRHHRFGQTKRVQVHMFTSEAEGPVLANLIQKGEANERMAISMANGMADITRSEVQAVSREVADYKPQARVRIPAWLRSHI